MPEVKKHQIGTFKSSGETIVQREAEAELKYFIENNFTPYKSDGKFPEALLSDLNRGSGAWGVLK